MSSWDPARVKSHIRITAQRLANFQEKREAITRQAQIEVASLLSQNDVIKARFKAERLCLWDIRLDVLGKLEMHCDSLLGSFSELREVIPQKDSPVFEPVCCILHVGHRIKLRELIILRDILIHRFGRTFLQWVDEHLQECLAPDMIRWLRTTRIPHLELNNFLKQVAESQGISWRPPPSQSEQDSKRMWSPKTTCMEESFTSRSLPYINKSHESRILLASRGCHTFDLSTEFEERRATYHELFRSFLASIPTNPPSEPLSAPDLCIFETAKLLSGLPPSLVSSLDAGAARTLNPDEIWSRLQLLDSSYSLTFSKPPESTIGPIEIVSKCTPLTPTKSANTITINHFLALLRILCVHSTVYPAKLSSILPTAVVFYNCLLRDTDPNMLEHLEADTFWMLQEISGEISDLQDESEIQSWMDRISIRLKQVDEELWNVLVRRGLDPRLPHFTYRWLGSMFAYTLPVDSLLVIWDAMLANEMRTSDTNFKLTFTVEVATALLICAKPFILRLGRTSIYPNDLWDDDQLDPLLNLAFDKESDQAFADGLRLLQIYPMYEIGGPYKVLEVIHDLPSTNHRAASAFANFPSPLASSFWRGLARRTGTPEPVVLVTDKDISNDSMGKKSHKTRLSLGERLKATVVRGISNEAAMEPDPSPSPSPPGTPAQSPFTSQLSLHMKSQSESMKGAPSEPTRHIKSPTLWDKTPSLKSSEFALSRLSKGLGAKVLSNWVPAAEPDSPRSAATAPELSRELSSPPSLHLRLNRDSYTPPMKPSIFHNPRDSFSPYSRRAILHAANEDYLSPDEGKVSDSSRSTSIASTLKSLSGIASPVPRKKTGPKPLLLDASKLMTPETLPIVTRSATTSPIPHQWSDVYREKAKAVGHRTEDSLSSVSSFSSPLRLNDGGSRVIPFNRTSQISRGKGTVKVTNASRHRQKSSTNKSVQDSASDSEYLSDVILARYRSEQEFDSPAIIPTPSTSLIGASSRDTRIKRGSFDELAHEPSNREEVTGSETPENLPRTPEKPRAESADTDRTPQIRSKKYASRLADLQLQKSLAPTSSEIDTEAITPKANAFRKPETSPSAARLQSGTPCSESDAEKGDDEESYDDLLSAY